MNILEHTEALQQLTQSKHWEWMPGMLAYCLDRECFIRIVDVEDEDLTTSIPDLHDLATIGCFIGIIRAAYNTRNVYVKPEHNQSADEIWSCNVLPRNKKAWRCYTGNTQLEALIAAFRDIK